MDCVEAANQLLPNAVRTPPQTAGNARACKGNLWDETGGYMEGPEMDGCVAAPEPLVVRWQLLVGILANSTLTRTGGSNGWWDAGKI